MPYVNVNQCTRSMSTSHKLYKYLIFCFSHRTSSKPPKLNTPYPALLTVAVTAALKPAPQKKFNNGRFDTPAMSNLRSTDKFAGCLREESFHFQILLETSRFNRFRI